ncbi:hypothetical protein LEN26_013813 [Aphanomyces euteiches]|nr:hypothetical protein LEN26_013813 [Aphanomyces euteiches]KAH9128411.1 hypothetical protein AeMF1_001418 [Aphanomyces euteiches]
MLRALCVALLACVAHAQLDAVQLDNEAQFMDLEQERAFYASTPDNHPEFDSFAKPHRSVTDPTACNGYVGYCNKTFGQVLWIGAHNSMSDVGEAIQRNQFVDSPTLLKAGVRYFDVDTCTFSEDGRRTSVRVCHGTNELLVQNYQDLLPPLQQMKRWLDLHPREVVILNFGDIADFSDGLTGEPSEPLKNAIADTVREAFGEMAILKGDTLDARVSADQATLQELIDANQRVVVNVGKETTIRHPLAKYWGQNDRVCHDAWYPGSLRMNIFTRAFDWQSVFHVVEHTMRQPCGKAPKILNKLEWAFRTLLASAIDRKDIGVTLNRYMTDLHKVNRHQAAPFHPFNLILTDHSDKWSQYYDSWHRLHLQWFEK